MNTKTNQQNQSRMMLTLICSLALVSLITSGCASTSGQRAHNPAELKKVVQGQTTKTEVRASLGEPNGVSRDGDGAEIWMYNWNNIQQKAKGRGFAMLGANVIGAFVPGATIAATVGSAALGSASAPAATCQTTTIAFNSEGVVASVNYNETSQK